MSQISNAEAFYEANLREVSRELTSMYWKFSKDLISGKPCSHYSDELCKLEFKVHNQICEQIIHNAEAFVKDLDRLYLVDTSQMYVAIDKAKRDKFSAERMSLENGNHEKSIQLIKATLDDIFNEYSGWKARRRNLERNALLKWLGGFGAVYTILMVVYFQFLNFMKLNPDFFLGLAIPVVIAFLGLYFVLSIFEKG